MATTQIRGNTQIMAATITNAEISASAAIATTKLADGALFLKSDGSVALGADLPAGGFKITGLGAPSGANDAVRLTDLQAYSYGLDFKASVRAATTANITLSNTQTIDGVALSAGNRVLVKDQSTASQNGIYVVVSGGAWTRATDADSSAEVTSGLTVYVSEGTANGSSNWTLNTPDPITLDTTSLTFVQTNGLGQITAGSGLSKTGNTLDVNVDGSSIEINSDSLRVKAAGITNAMLAGSIAASKLVGTDIATVGTVTAGTWNADVISSTYGGTGVNNGGRTLTVNTNSGTLAFSASGKTLTIADNATVSGTNTGDQTITLSGDISGSGTGAITTTIGSNKVTLGMLATLAANSVIGNSTGSTATPTAVSMLATATASSIAYRNSSANLLANNFVPNATTTATAAGTTTLTVTSAYLQQFTGSTTQTVVLPDATTLTAGHSFLITNRSSGAVTVNANGGGLIKSMAASSQAVFTVISVGTSAGTWDVAYSITNAGAGGGTVTSVSIASANGFTGTSDGNSSSPALTIATSVSGILKGNGTAISAATVGTDYVNNASFVYNETPSGSVNGSNTTFTLANTPTAGTVQVYLNGQLQEPGSGNDYTISGATITYLTAPATNDKIRVHYMK